MNDPNLVPSDTDPRRVAPRDGGHEAVCDRPLRTALKSYDTILQQQVEQAEQELERPPRELLVSAFAAGIEIGVGPFLMAVLLTLLDGTYPAPVVELLQAAAYAAGFIVVVLGRSELFTEHTALAVQPVLAGTRSIGQMLRLWGLVYLGNVAGAMAFAALAVWIGPKLGEAEPWAFERIAGKYVDHVWWVLLIGGVLAGWLMGLMAWLVTAARDTTAQVLLVGLIAFAIGIAHLQHSIAGTVEVFAGLVAGEGRITWPEFGRFLLGATVGNAVGGAVFVALLKYGHAKGGGRNGARL